LHGKANVKATNIYNALPVSGWRNVAVDEQFAMIEITYKMILHYWQVIDAAYKTNVIDVNVRCGYECTDF
jgi:hypothetical protein